MVFFDRALECLVQSRHQFAKALSLLFHLVFGTRAQYLSTSSSGPHDVVLVDRTTSQCPCPEVS